MDLLIINRYTCPRTLAITVQAHLLCLTDMTINKSFPRMSADNDYLDLFTAYKNVIIADVPKISMIDDINIVNKH